MLYAMGASVNSLVKDMGAIRRIAKEAILHGLCQESMGVSVIVGNNKEGINENNSKHQNR